MMRFKNLAERQILKAQADGTLDNLEGAGQPLPHRPGNAAEAAGFRMMADAGVLPREFALKKERDAIAERLAKLTDPDARKSAMAALAEVDMRLAIEQEARRKFLK